MLLLLATIEVVGASFTRQLEQNSIQNFESSIQVPNIITNQIASQLSRANSKSANQQLSQIISNYNLGDISQLMVVDNKGVIRAVSNVNDQNRIGQRTSNADIKSVLSNGKQVSKVINDNGNYMVQISPLTSSNCLFTSNKISKFSFDKLYKYLYTFSGVTKYQSTFFV